MSDSPLSQYFTLQVDDKEREIFMSFGLLNELTGLIGDPVRCTSVYFDEDLRAAIICSVLSERDKRGKVTKRLDDITDVSVDLADIELLLNWVTGHVLGFFTRSLKSVMGMKDQLNGMAGLASSLAGSNDSPSKKASAGRSKSSSAASEKSTGQTASQT